MKFELTDLEKQRVKTFEKKCKKAIGDDDVRLSYHFYPGGIGTTVYIKSETLETEEDITDLDNW